MLTTRSGSDAHLRGTCATTLLAAAILPISACHGYSSTTPPGSRASVDVHQSDLVPRVPSHNPNVYLYARVTNLAFGTSLSITANAVPLPGITRDGVWPLIRDVPIGTLYDVAIPTHPRGQNCLSRAPIEHVRHHGTWTK